MAVAQKQVYGWQQRNVRMVQIQYQFVPRMKNTRIEQPSPHLYLASKRSSLNQDKLPQPYKIEWGPSSLQSNDVRSSSNKNFFQNMKDELSNIKQDFQKLIKKQNNYTSASKTGKEENLYSTGLTLGSGLKGKSLSSYKKDSRKYAKEPLEETDKLQFIMNHQEMQDSYKNKLYSIEKLQPQSDKKNISKINTPAEKQYKASNPLSKIHSKLLEERQQQHSEAILSHRPPLTDTKKYQEQLQNIKDQLLQVTAQLSAQKIRSQALRVEAESAKSQQAIFKTKLAQLSQELTNKMQYAEAQEKKIIELNQILSNQQRFIGESAQIRNEIQKQRAFYNDKINELVFHNDNFHNINAEIGRENETLRANLENLHHYVEQLKSINENTENDHKRKLQFMKKDIDQYKKRQTMYEKQIENLTNELRAKNSNVQNMFFSEQSSQKQEILRQNQMLKMEVDKHQKQVLLQQRINASLTAKYEQQLKKMNIKSFAQSLQRTIRELTEQNAKLKSKINILEADLDSLKEQNRSYLKEITLYEDRQRTNLGKKQYQTQEWEQLNEQIERLQKENSRLQEELQFKQVKAEVDKQHLIVTNCDIDKLIKMSHAQLQQIERLKETIKDLKDENEFLRRQLERQGQICVNLKRQNKQLTGLSKPQDKKHCCYIKEMELIDRKNVQINALKRLILKVMVQKVGKSEGETDSEFWLRKLQQLKLFLGQQ